MDRKKLREEMNNDIIKKSEEFSNLEQKAVELVNKYGLMIRDEVFSHKKHSLPCGGNYPNAKTGCREDSEEYSIMKRFLDSHPEYQTQNSEFVRDWYGI